MSYTDRQGICSQCSGPCNSRSKRCRSCFTGGAAACARGHTYTPETTLVEYGRRWCSICRDTKAAAWYAENHTTKQEQGRRYRYKKQYGITIEEYNQILLWQGGVCALCLRLPKPGRNLHVDHDHKSGATRGLLCFSCNMRVGRERESAWFARAASYMDANPASLALGRTPQGILGPVKKRRRRQPRKTTRQT